MEEGHYTELQCLAVCTKIYSVQFSCFALNQFDLSPANYFYFHHSHKHISLAVGGPIQN